MSEQSKSVEVKTGGGESKTGGSLVNLRERMNHLFDEFQDSWPFGLKRSPVARSLGAPFDWDFNTPAMEFVEKDDLLAVKVELPGIEEKDIDVRLSDRLLTVSGEKKEEHEEGEKESDYYFSERRFGTFKRSVSIPESADVDKVKATFKNGVLTVTLPKNGDAAKEGKKVEITK